MKKSYWSDTMKKMTGRMITGALTLIILLGTTAATQAAFVVNVQGKKIEGTDIRAKSTGEIILTTTRGTRTFLKNQYVHAEADKPAEYDQARKLIDAGQYEKAIDLLEDIIRRYRFLAWDNRARALLPMAYAGQDQFDKAVSAYEDLFENAPKSRENDELIWGYREALLRAQQYAKLEKQLDEIIAAGSREDAARAQIMRGDIRLDQDQLEPAVLDYLRTVVLFENVEAYQPEANFKAAEVLEQLHDRRAEDLYRVVVEQYPSSPYAAQARGKL